MKWNDIYNFYKNKYNDYIIFYKVGNFYNVIGVDVYIMSYIFNYKIINNNGIEKIGFPISNINKVMSKLDNLKINYLTLSKDDGIIKVSYKKHFRKNNYGNYSLNSNDYCIIRNRINNIISILNDKLDDTDINNILDKIESIIDER